MIVSCQNGNKVVNITERNMVSLEVKKSNIREYEVAALFIGYCYGNESVSMGAYAQEEEAKIFMNWLIDMMDDGTRFATMPDRGQIKNWNRDGYRVDF